MKESLPVFDVVIYHRNCLDGFASLLVAFAGNVLVPGDKIWFHASGADERNSPPHLSPHKNVLILDVNMNYNTVKKLVDSVALVYMVDHHTNKDHDKLMDLAKKASDKFRYIYDTKESAATLVWNWLSPDRFNGKPPNRFLNFIKDNDLGVWENTDTQNFILGLEVKYNTQHGLSREKTYEKLEKWKTLMSDEDKIDRLIKLGKKVKLYQNLILSRMEINTEIVEITNPNLNKKVKMVVTNGCVYLAKKMAVRLAKKFRDEVALALVWYYNVSTNMIQCVVRSDTQNVLWLLQLYGGGGHPRAGTFSFKSRDLYEWLSIHERKIVRANIPPA